MSAVHRVNVANVLTVGRLILAPFFVVAYAFADVWPEVSGVVAPVTALWVLFVIMELTDVLDGMIARRQGMVTDLGKVLDPFADVVCRMTYFTTLVVAGIMPLWFVIIVLYREFGAVFLRLLLYRDGLALAAGPVGKLKSWFYSVAATVGLFLFTTNRLPPVYDAVVRSREIVGVVAYVVYAVAAVLSVWSFVIYLRVYARRRSGGPDR